MSKGNYLKSQLESELLNLQKNNAELTALLREKDKQIRKIQHQVKNNLQILASFLHLQSLKIDNAVAAKYLNDTALRLNFLSLMQTHFCVDNRNIITQKELENFIIDLQNRVANACKIETGMIKLLIQLVPIEIASEPAMTLGFILSEIFKLLFEFEQAAFKDRKIVINTQLTDDHFFRLTIIDSLFMELSYFEQLLNNSFEMEIIRSLVQYQLRGTIELENTNERFLVIQFKIEN
jgi:two-component sensor histidine kinase